jgi:predicted nicotinamide N-methyase
LDNCSVEYYRWGANEISGKKFDLIVGSDIIYSGVTDARAISKSIMTLLEENGTAILANDLIRYSQLESDFEKALIDDGLKVVDKRTLLD